MKLFFKILLGGFVLSLTLAIIGMVALGLWAQDRFVKKAAFDQPTEITIDRGSNINTVAEQLLYYGALNDTKDLYIFQYGGRLTEQASKIKAGEYEIPAHSSMQEILDLFESGKVIQRQITIREGLTSHEIVKLLSAHEGLLPSKIESPAEGGLLPETYSYQKGDHVDDVLHRMNYAMIDQLLGGCKVFIDLQENTLVEDILAMLCEAPEPLETVGDVLILASIIEKETAVPSERKQVAGVFVNRLRKGMLLQTDPTVIYAINGGKHENNGKGPLGRRLLKKDLEIDNPYNTYKYAGLPPGPICNPGKDSIEAALSPAEHKYLYFVADGTGGHAFGKSLAEHNRNVAKWRKIRKSQ